MQAMLALDQALAPFALPGGGAGDEIHQMVDSWRVQDPGNAAVINQGQLKATAKPFYDRLAQLGLWPRGALWAPRPPSTIQQGEVFAETNGPADFAQWEKSPRYPWRFWVSANTWSQKQRSTLFLQTASVGQLKNVFNFDPAALLTSVVYQVTGQSRHFITDGLPTDSDEDGVNDMLEILLGSDPGSATSTLTSVNPYAADSAAPSSLSEEAAARFLLQASWGPTWESIADVRTKGIEPWIDMQIDEDHPGCGFCPNGRGVQQIPWHGVGALPWINLWHDWPNAPDGPFSPKLFPSDTVSYEARRDSAVTYFATLGSGVPPGTIATQVPLRYAAGGSGYGGVWGINGLLGYLKELVGQAPRSPNRTLAQDIASAQLGWDGVTVALQTTRFYASLDATWKLPGTTISYSDYDGPTPAVTNSSHYPSYANSEPATSRTRMWMAARDTADSAERGPYNLPTFPQRGIAPYMFYLHWRKLTIDRPLWEKARELGWMAKRFDPGTASNPRVLPWPYVMSGVDENDAGWTSSIAPSGMDDAWLHRAVYDPDQLRQRVTWALSQILVVSDYNFFANDTAGVGYPAPAHYYDMLTYHAFRNFSDLLTAVTFHPLMGAWLTYNGSVGEVDDVNNETLHPDENYAREIMQLFSMGLHELKDDGTPRLDGAGNKIFTYTQEDVRQLARIFTGMNKRGAPLADDLPMQVIAGQHDIRKKTVLGRIFTAMPGGHSAATAETEIRDAVNHIATRPSVAPYICRQLIQHLTSSNPSPAYVRRVVAVWRSSLANPATANQQLGLVVKAILTDDEARSADTALTSSTTGHLRDPMTRMLGLMRAFNAGGDYTGGGQAGQNPLDTPMWSWGHYVSDSTHVFQDLRQAPFLSPSVFSFYAPGFAPAGDVFNARLLGPEYQLVNSASVASTIGRLWSDTDYTQPTLLATAPYDGYSVAGTAVVLKQGELILHYAAPSFFQSAGGSLVLSSQIYLTMPEGFSSSHYGADYNEKALRLWQTLPYTTPGSSLDFRGKSLRLHFGTRPNGSGGTVLAITPAQRSGTAGITSEADAFINELDILLCAGRMTAPTRKQLKTLLAAATNTGENAKIMQPSDPYRRERAAVQLLIALPEAAIVR